MHEGKRLRESVQGSRGAASPEGGPSSLGPHDHACLIFDGFSRELPLFVSYIRDGFSRNERVLVILDEPGRSLLAGALESAGVDLVREAADKRYAALSSRQAYLAGEGFDPEAMAGFLEQETDASLALGFSGLRVMGEAAWSAEGLPGSERLIEYEEKLAYFFPVRPCTALCLYDRTRLPAKVLRDAILTHPLILFEGKICENGFFIPPEEYQGPVRDLHVVDSLLSGLALHASRMQEANEELRRLDEQRRIFLERFQGIAYQVSAGSFFPDFYEGDILGITGYEKEEFSPAGMAWERLVNPEDRPGFFSEAERVWADPGASMDMEYRIVRKDGSVRWVRDTNRSVVGPDGERMIQGTIRDVTERKTAEDQVRNNAARLACLLEIARHRALSEQDLLDFALEKAVLLTRSKVGNIYLYDESKDTLCLFCCSKEARSACGLKDVPKSLKLSETGLWASAVHSREPIIVNDYQADVEGKRGCPRGHIPLHRFLAVPVLSGDGVAAVIGVANKTGPYDETDVLQLSLLMDSVWKMKERARVEAARIETEKKLALILEHIRETIWLADLDFKVTWATPSVKRSRGFSVEDLADTPLIEHLTPASREKASGILAELFTPENLADPDKEIRASAELEVYRKDGSTFINEASITLLRDEQGKPAQILGVGRDVTDRVRAEQELGEEREKAARYLEIAPAIIIALDVDGDITLLNEKGCEILECTREEAIGANWFTNFLPEEVLEQVRDIWAGLMDGRQEVFEYAENPVVTKKGNERIIRWRNRLLYDDDGRITGLISSGEDVSEQRAAQEALRLSEERFRTTLYSIGDGVITTDTEGRIMQMNPVAEEMTGWKEEEARSRLVEEVFAIANEYTLEPVESPVPRVLRDGLVVGLANHTVLMAKDGKVRPIADSGAPIRNSRGEVTGVVLVFADQSERRRMEGELRQSQKVEAIGRLAGGIAHDFNNMLGVIIGNADLALQKLAFSDPLYHDLKEIDRAARRSADLTRQLLAFARKQPVSPRVLDLGEAVEDSRKMLARLVGENIGFFFAPEKGLWPVLLDPAQLDQVLANLVLNSRDAIEGVGSIVIGIANETVAERNPGRHQAPAPGDYVVLSVSDDGCGMEDSVREHLFEPFFTTKGQGKGTGLGLCTVHGIVSQNRGFLDYDTGPGKGTCFRLYFPRSTKSKSPAVPFERDSPLAGTESILVVEDEEQILNLAAAMLRHYGYRVLTAPNPGDALLLCERHDGPIDLLLTDVVMPLMNGKDLRDRLRSLRPGLKSLFMSGYTEEIIAGSALEEAKENFLQKPFKTADLVKKVREVLDSGPGSR